jgi:hypothetical protein
MASGDSGPGVEQRRAPRFTLLIRTAKLVSDGREYLCVIRDISATGLSVRLFHPLPTDCPLALELGDGQQVGLKRVWEDGDAMGLLFERELDPRVLLDQKSTYRRRPVRLRLELEGTIAAGDRHHRIEVRNLSQQGACVVCEERLAIGQRVTLEMDGLPAIRATVRWRDVREFGLVFEDTFKFDEFARLTARLQQGTR